MKADDAANEAPECLSCGVCCFSTLTRYIPVTGNDYARLGDEAVRLVTWTDNRAYMRLEDGHCAALAIDATTEQFVCTTYATRPETCRELGRGSPACEGERITKGERPLVALRARRNA